MKKKQGLYTFACLGLPPHSSAIGTEEYPCLAHWPKEDERNTTQLNLFNLP